MKNNEISGYKRCCKNFTNLSAASLFLLFFNAATGKITGVFKASAGAFARTFTSLLLAASVAYTTPQEALPFATQFKTSVTFVPKLLFSSHHSSSLSL